MGRHRTSPASHSFSDSDDWRRLMNHSDKTKCGPVGAGEINTELDADKAKYWLDDQALDRIITAVGESPAKPDRDSLPLELLKCYGLSSIASPGPGTD